MTFHPPPGYQPFYNLSIPYVGPIYGGLREGMALFFQGSVPRNARRFSINLQYGERGECYKALHFNPRPESDMIVFNSFRRRKWEAEERIRDTEFREGASFELLIAVTKEGYQVKVNGREIYLYRHRVSTELVCGLLIIDDVTIDTVSIIGGGPGFIQAYPGKVVNVPHIEPIYGRLQHGMALLIHGTIPHDSKRFFFNLQRGLSQNPREIALHFDVRFENRTAVFNTLTNGEWGDEEVKALTFSPGDSFEVLILINYNGFQVNVNGRVFEVYDHRTPLFLVDALSIHGDVNIRSINLVEGEDGAASVVSWDHLPMMWTGPFYNPAVPYSTQIAGGMSEKKTFAFSGRILPKADRFHINFKVGSSNDNIAFQFNPRTVNGTVVRNSSIDGKWGSEERDLKFNPFQVDQCFGIVIRCESEKFTVFVNGQHFCDYDHRIKPFTDIDTLEVTGDVNLAYIHF